MKKIISCMLLGIGLSACKKTTQPPVLVTETEESTPVTAPSLTAKSTTVTTEAALKAAVSAAVPGDIITISGTINLTSTLQLLKSGTASAKINITGGVLNCSGLSSGWGVKVNGSYWNITNMTIKNGPDAGIVFQTGGFNYVYNVITTGNHDTGLQIYNGSHDNNISYCNSHDNYDTQNGGENADGFACKLSGGANNKFDHCTSTHNSDDGWDLYGQPYTVKITNCTATSNGFGTNGDGNGFKLGSAGQNVPHTVTNCTSSNNKAAGYDGNGNTGHITTTGSGGSGNGTVLFYRIM
ncbi:MAG: right-handed parallel beta-helix repeat-containing protein [Chitinophagaceae bacterium]